MNLAQILLSSKKIQEKDLEDNENNSVSFFKDLVKKGTLEQQDFFHALARYFDMEILPKLPLDLLQKEFYKQLPYLFVKKHIVLPFKENDTTLFVAINDPLNLDVIDELRALFSKSIQTVWMPRDAILEAIDKCYHQDEGVASQLIADLTDDSYIDNNKIFIDDLLDDREQAPIIKLLNVIITEAIQMGASDIHFEPFENDLKVRYRIDGVLQKRHAPPKEYHSHLMTRLKVMAKLDIAEHRLPQDGRIKLKMGGKEIDFRVSTIPVSNGERIVLRILDKSNVHLGLNQIGMPQALLKNFKNLISYPEGIVLVTGPTGSGKTTTLYSAISELYSDEINIMTIEDPVEYKLPGIAQIGVQPKINLDFATGLRHILRQDPDIILIGEIRDKETAEIAIQSSLTGHLVLSTLHTNDAPSSIPRLIDMGIEPYLIASSMVGILAQRLVRTLCPSCKEAYIPRDDELSEIGLNLSHLFRARGCSSCYGSGYKGRHGIYELMTITSNLKRQIATSADTNIIREHALQEGMKSLKDNGMELVKKGLTTYAEVLRVVK
ncbi:MAG: type II secretion system ATPase GspE [Chlamydiales bacterium]|nr:type II secretion system ATPase GspE [Chlamydiales bacterium]